MKRENVFLKNYTNAGLHISSETHMRESIVAYDHIHKEIEFIYIASGKFKCRVRGDDYILTDGDIIFINSNQPHSTQNLLSGTESVLLQFSLSNSQKKGLKPLEKLIMHNYCNETLAVCHVFRQTDTEYPDIKNDILKILEGYSEDSVSSDYFVLSYLYNLLGYLYKIKFLANTEDILNNVLTTKFLPVIEYINEHYRENLSLDTLSVLLNLDSCYFSRAFKNATGVNVVEYINFVRLYNATDLFSENLSLTEISEMVGFSSLSYFNKTFKKYMKCSPTYYKKNNINRDRVK